MTEKAAVSDKSKEKKQKKSRKKKGGALERFQDNTGITFGITMKVVSVILLLTILPLLVLFIAADLGIGDIKDLAVNESRDELSGLAEENLVLMAEEKAAQVNKDFDAINNTLVTFSNMAEYIWSHQSSYNMDLGWYYHNYTEQKALENGKEFKIVSMIRTEYSAVQFANSSFGAKADAYYNGTIDPVNGGDTAVDYTVDLSANAKLDADLSANIEQFMVNSKKLNSNIDGLYMGFESGTFRILPFPAQPRSIDYIPAERGWYKAAKAAAGQVIWTDPYMDSGSWTPMITCAKGIYNNGTFIGVVGIDVALAAIQSNILATNLPYEGSRSFLINLDGSTIAHSKFNISYLQTQGVVKGDEIPATPLTVFEDFDSFNLFKVDYSKKISGYVLDKADNATYGNYIAYSRVSSLGYVVGFIVPEDKVVEPAEATGELISKEGEAVAGRLYAIFIGTIFLALIIGGGVGWRIVDPIKKLTHSAERVRAGQLDESINIDARDEIGTLAKSFEKMVAAIKLANIMAAKEAGVVSKEGPAMTAPVEQKSCAACGNPVGTEDDACPVCGETLNA